MFKLTLGGRKVVQELAAEVPRAMRAAGEAAGQFHVTHHMPLHFTRQAYARYGNVYRERSKGYDRWKSRRKGHRDPLVKSGALKRDMLGGAVTVSKKRGGETVEIGMRVPRYVWYRRKRGDGSPGADKVAELLAIRPDELEALTQVYGDVFKAALEDPRMGKRARAVARRSERLAA